MVNPANVSSNASWGDGNGTVAANSSSSHGVTSILYLYPHIAIPTLVAGAVIFLVGVVGNVVVVASVLRFKQGGIYFYLLSLSVADLLVLLFGLPIKIAEWFFLSEWVLGKAMCKILAYLQMLSFTASVMTLTAIAIERKFVILNPVKARTQQGRHRAYRALLLVWVISLILSSPILYPATTRLFEGGDGEQVCHCVHAWPAPLYGRLYAVYNLVVILAVPLCVMTYMYIRSGHEVLVARKGGYQGTKHGRKDRNIFHMRCLRKICGKRSRDPVDPDSDNVLTAHRRGTLLKVIKFMIGLVAVFTICWAPLLIYNLLIKFEVISRYTQTAYILKLALHLLAHSNSCANPVCYAFLSRHFRLRGKPPSGNWMASRSTMLRATTTGSGPGRSKPSIHMDRATYSPSNLSRSTGYTSSSATYPRRWNSRHGSPKDRRTCNVTSSSSSYEGAKLHVTLHRTCSLTIETTSKYPVEPKHGTGKVDSRQYKSAKFRRRLQLSDNLSESGVFGEQDQNYELATIGELSNQVLKPVHFETSV
ncbi:PREDICTED: pyroglutamylated RFamide peptide receptor-like [Branchiostoma belcheri]|uniref:Pyroglutamylated RFamide peptide receptor-like n=1 Tax=Branchiostoma belcheri TaxID=7741 RepID=A0A6P5A842_BRABE|nr:PREDICTED: pyroglutamylated RFamide peptide receptor-like [Branchiostoma belcheri]